MNGATLENSECFVNNTDQNGSGSIHNAYASENIESDSQPEVQNGCVQTDSTEPVQGGSTNTPLQEGVNANMNRKRDCLRQLIAVHEQNYDENYQEYESEAGDEEDQSDMQEADGCEPEDQIAWKKRCSTSTTTLSSTDQGQLAVKTVGIKKRVPHQFKHMCH